MNRDDITRMAREAGCRLINDYYTNGTERSFNDETLERFAALIVAAEREACAKMCDAQVIELGQSREALVAGICAADIRARGQK